MVLTTQFSPEFGRDFVFSHLFLSPQCWQRWSRSAGGFPLHVTHPQGIPEAMSQVIGKTVCPLV